MNALAILGFRKLTVHAVLIVLAPLALDGCLSIGVDRTRLKTPDASAPCSLEARLYETGKHAKRDVKSTRPVTWRLFHLDTSPDLRVRDGTGATWSASDLPPGKYRIAATWGPKPGVSGETSAGAGDDTFSLAAGDTARVDFVLSRFPLWGWIAIGATVVGIVVAVLYAVALNDLLKGIHLSTSPGPAPSPAAGRRSGDDAVQETATR